MLDRVGTVLVLVDVQGKLAQMMYQRDELFRNLRILARGMQLLEVPIILMEQTPEKLGPTVPEVSAVLADIQPIEKKTFSCARAPEFRARLRELEPRNVVLAGIEAHVCVYQTAADLIEQGYGVHLVVDAVSSRTESNRKAGVHRILSDGGHATTAEMLLFELQRSAEGDVFRELIKLVR